jgi:CRISPR-associated protein Csc3
MTIEDDDLLSGDFGFDDNASDRTIETERKLLTLKLLREAIHAQNPNDWVMADFAEYVLPNILRLAIGVTAKGGKFFDEIDQQREAKGKERVRRDNAADQSLNTHLLNGLFPANLIERRLEKLDTTIRRVVREVERRLVIAGFILHDFEKFPDVPQNCRKLPIEEHRKIIDEKIRHLGLDYFINPGNPEAYREYIDDLLCMAYNAQRRWDTNWNFSEYGLNPVLRDRTLSTFRLSLFKSYSSFSLSCVLFYSSTYLCYPLLDNTPTSDSTSTLNLTYYLCSVLFYSKWTSLAHLAFHFFFLTLTSSFLHLIAFFFYS